MWAINIQTINEVQSVSCQFPKYPPFALVDRHFTLGWLVDGVVSEGTLKAGAIFVQIFKSLNSQLQLPSSKIVCYTFKPWHVNRVHVLEGSVLIFTKVSKRKQFKMHFEDIRYLQYGCMLMVTSPKRQMKYHGKTTELIFCDYNYYSSSEIKPYVTIILFILPPFLVAAPKLTHSIIRSYIAAYKTGQEKVSQKVAFNADIQFGH